MKIDVVRAWKDEEYRRSLSPSELAALPANPAGVVEIDDQDLRMATGGAESGCTCTCTCCSCCCCDCSCNCGGEILV
jgi:mersacidin/lichenicidin family type 2 lantibiotic